MARTPKKLTAPSDVGFYYPGHVWRETDWLKTMLLFFDGFGLLVPEYKKDHAIHVDPVLAGPLRDMGLLHYLVADEVVDKAAAGQLAEAMDALITAGAFEGLEADGTAFHEISRSRMGYFGDEQVAADLFAKLKERGLARESEDGASIPMHRLVRIVILTFLAQILKPQGKAHGLILSPITDRSDAVRALTEILDVPSLASTGHIVSFDLQNVAVDLSAVPLDEVLAFRTQHLRQHRGYMKSIRSFAHEVALTPRDERDRLFEERQTELDDLASDLRQASRSAWRAPVSFGIGLAGAGWTYATGDPLGALLGGGAIVAGGVPSQPNEAGAYSYLFAANKRFA